MITNTNWINKLVTLTEENPFVKTFDDVELILNTLFGESKVTVTEVSNDFPKLQIVDLDTKVESLVPFSKLYEVYVDGDLFEVLVENWNSNESAKFVVKLLFDEIAQTYDTTLL